jgi:HEAT repeat protein
MEIKPRQIDYEWFKQYGRTSFVYQIMDDVINGKHRDERIRGIQALGDRGDPRAVQTLLYCCSDKDPGLRIQAINALSRLRSGRSVPTLIERLNDENEVPGARESAAEALMAIHCFSATGVLMERVNDENEDPSLREYIAVLLGVPR